jgi:sortase B
MKVRKIIEGIVLVAAIAVFGVAGYKLYSYMEEAKKESDVVNMLSDNAVRIYEAPTNDKSGKNTDESQNSDGDSGGEVSLNVDFDYLLGQNEDIKAWIYSPDTVINYPVLQSSDNDFYIHRLADKTYNNAGSLFMDYRNSSDFSDYLTIIYGHHMKNGAMFGTLSSYKKQDYYDKHPIIYLTTPNDSYALELIAGFVTNADSKTYIIPQSIKERDEFVNSSIKQSAFDAGFDVSSLSDTDRLVMLSTCSYEYENARFVVVGVLKLTN